LLKVYTYSIKHLKHEDAKIMKNTKQNLTFVLSSPLHIFVFNTPF